jgi:hypothetical protein
MSKSKWRNQRRLPKESRTIPRRGNRDRGNGLDFRKWFNCWHCGFICKLDRDELGGASSRAGTAHEDYLTPSDPSINNVSVLGGPINNFQVSLELGSDGNPKEILHGFKSVISSGCPLCGCRNWMGKY